MRVLFKIVIFIFELRMKKKWQKVLFEVLKAIIFAIAGALGYPLVG